MTDYQVNYGFSKAGSFVPAQLGGPQVLSPPMPRPQGGMLTGGWPVPILTGGMTFSDVGTSGLRQFGGWVREEFLPQLVGRQASRTYREMLDNSATVGSIMYTIRASMRRVDWRVEPADDTPAGQEAADFVQGCMDDMSHTWSDFVDEVTSKLGYGFAPHEIVYKRRLGRNAPPDPRRPGKSLPPSKYDDQRIGWRKLALRGQDTILKWFFDEDGGIQGLTQQPWFGPLVDIPIEKLLLFRVRPHKNNPEGYSILRTAYRSWYIAKRLEEQEAILFERLSGLPVISVPSDLLDQAANGNAEAQAKLNAFKMIATNVRIDEQMGLVIPSDRWPTRDGSPSNEPMYKFELVSPSAAHSNVDSDKAITRYNINMLTSVMADFLQLGHQARGTQALATNKVDMFMQSIEGFLNSDADVLNRHGVPRLWALNGFDYDLMPRIVPDLAQRLDLDVLSNYVLRLTQAGMPLFPDLDVENYLRDAAGIPDVTDEAAYSATTLLDDQIMGQPEAPPTDQNAEPAPEEGDFAKRYPLHAIVKASLVRRLARHQLGRTDYRTDGLGKRRMGARSIRRKPIRARSGKVAA